MSVTVVVDGSTAENTRDLSWTIPTLAVGDVVVIAAETWDQGYTLAVPSGAGLSFVERVEVDLAVRNHAYIWTAVASSGGTDVVVTSAVTGGNCVHTGVLYKFPTADGYSLAGTPSTNQASFAGGGLPQVALTGTSGNTAVWVAGDWSGNTGSVTLLDAGVSDLNAQTAGSGSQYYGRQPLTGGSTTVGMTAPTATGGSIIAAMEVLFTEPQIDPGYGYLLLPNGVDRLIIEGTVSDKLLLSTNESPPAGDTIQAAVALVGTSTLTTAAPDVLKPAAVSLTTSSTLTTAAPTTTRVAAVGLTSTSTLTTAAPLREQPGAVTLSGTSTLATSAPTVIQPAAVSMASTSTLTTAAPSVLGVAAVALTSTSTLTSAADVSGSGTLPPGVRASAGTVGYLGDPGDLTVLNYGDSLVGTVFEGTATNWSDGTVLNIKGDDLVVDGYQFNDVILLHNSGANLTIKNCVVNVPSGAFFGIGTNGPSQGLLVVEDTSLVCVKGPGITRVGVGITSDSRSIIRRCDIDGAGDSIHACGYQGTDYASGTIISQCYVHNGAFLDPEQHADYIQIFNAPSNYTSDTGQTYLTIEHCATDVNTAPDGTPYSAGVTMGFPNAEVAIGPWLSAKIDNNLLPCGLNHLRVQYRQNNTVVTNNNFGFRNPQEVALAGVEQAAIDNTLTWSNNIDGNGDPYQYNDLGPTAPVSAAVSMTATSTFGAAGIATKEAQTALVATSTLTTAITRAHAVAVSVASTSSLTVAASTLIRPAAVALVAASTLSTAAFRGLFVAVPLTSTSTLAASSDGNTAATAALTSTSTLLVGAPLRIAVAAVALSTASTLTIQAPTRIRPAAVDLSSVSTFTVAAVKIRPSQVALTSTSTLDIAGIRISLAAATMTAQSALAINAVKERPTVVSLAGISVLDLGVVAERLAQVSLSAEAVLLTQPSMEAYGSVSLASQSVLQASAVIVGQADDSTRVFAVMRANFSHASMRENRSNAVMRPYWSVIE